MKLSTLTLVSAVALSAAVPAFAQTATARAGTELSVRAEPTPFAPVVGVLEVNQDVTINGCLEDVSWCEIVSGDITGWASGAYLYVEEDANAVALLNRPGTITLTTVERPDPEQTQTDQNAAAAAGATIGSLIAYSLGGPAAGIVAGGILGTAGAVATVEPSEETITFIQQNPVETVYLDGEVVIGAGVPAEVTTYDVPQSEFQYLAINGVPVLIDSESRVIVDVIR